MYSIWNVSGCMVPTMDWRDLLLEPVVVGAVAVTARSISEVDDDLTLLQWRALVVIGLEPEGISVGDVASRIGARSSAVSRLLGRLQRRGLVERRRHPDDRRSTRIRLTTDGATLVGLVMARRRGLLRSLPLRVADQSALERLARAFEGLS